MVSEHVNIWFWKKYILLKYSFRRLILAQLVNIKIFLISCIKLVAEIEQISARKTEASWKNITYFMDTRLAMVILFF